MRAMLAVSIALGAAALPARAQKAEDSVRTVVHQALDGLASRDTAMLRRVFAPWAQLVLLSYEGDSSVVRGIPTRAIAAGLTQPGPRPREIIRNERISIVSDMATLSADYVFYYDDTLHHCGVAMYDLVRTKRAWLIVQIRETDRRVGCTP